MNKGILTFDAKLGAANGGDVAPVTSDTIQSREGAGSQVDVRRSPIFMRESHVIVCGA